MNDDRICRPCHSFCNGSCSGEVLYKYYILTIAYDRAQISVMNVILISLLMSVLDKDFNVFRNV